MTKQPHPSDFSRTLEEFYTYLRQLLGVYDRLVPVLEQELDILIREDLPALDENLKAQQVLVSQTRNFDQTVTGYYQKLGIQGDTLTEFALQLQQPEHLRFFELLTEYETTFRQINFYRDKCRSLLQTRLHRIDKVLSAHSVPRDKATYDRNASGVQSGLLPQSFEKKV